MSNEGKTVVEALAAVMGDVQAVRKADRNQQQNFNFRGIDAVVNAVGPALRKHGVLAVPVGVVPHFEQYETKSGTQMRNTTLTVTFRFYGPMGDHLEAQTMGEASDAGDKSVSKAHSVAYRTLLLQALCIPTDEPDPDEQSHARARPAEADPRLPLWSEIKALGRGKGLTDAEIADDFASWSQGVVINAANVTELTDYLTQLKAAS